MTPLYDRLAAQALRRPEALALQCGEQALSYRDLLALADKQAAGWQADGLGQGSFIGWLGHNSTAMVAALLACAKLGAVWVPLNWRLAAPELAAIAAHAGLATLRHTPELAALAAQVLALLPGGLPATAASAAPSASAAAPAQAGDLMLVYTSGSTGDAKGVMHSQAGMCANIDMALAVQGLTAVDRVLAVLPLFHVGGLCIQLLPALAVGAAVKLHARFDPGAWLQDLTDWWPSTSLLVPAAMQAILAHPHWPEADVSSLRFLNCGSQVVPLALIEAFHACGVPVAQVYGSTETGPVSIALRPADAMAHAGTVGQAAPGVRWRLVDAAGTVVSMSEVGEIQLQAPNLMRGYHRQPAGSGFVDGWFATGDLARANADGWITVVGRRSDLIISGGENLYPAEIENLVVGWPGVAEAVVLGWPDARWGEVPVLVLTARPGETVDLAALRDHLALRLARFKQPRQILLADSLPRTALGKVQKAALRERLAVMSAVAQGSAGPTSPAG